MSSPNEIRDMIENSSEKEKKQYRHCWRQYLGTIESQAPQIIIPKSLGDQLGNDAMEDVARRFR
jgi:hypothetical protein